MSRRWSNLSGLSNFTSSPSQHFPEVQSCSEDEEDVSLTSNISNCPSLISSNLSEEQELEKRKKKVFLVAQEMTKTEEDFVENLHLLNIHFRKAVKNQKHLSSN